MKPVCAVLLSSYDGEKYIAEQIDSVLGQSYSNLRLYIRDDGSSDGTAAILGSYAGDKRVSVSYEENIGVWRSFFQLLKTAGGASFYAFCDQDDVWLKDKLSYAVERLTTAAPETPAAYFSRLDVVDAKLEHLSYSPKYEKPLGLKTAIAGNVLTGAACVINKAARDLIADRLPEFTVMHDWWVYIVVSAFGNIYYDERPMLKYRQHKGNQIGLAPGAIKPIIKRLKKYTTGGYYKKISLQAKDFYRLYGDDLTDGDKFFLEKFIKEKNIFERLAYAVTCPAYRQKAIDNALFRALILINQI